MGTDVGIGIDVSQVYRVGVQEKKEEEKWDVLVFV
jgi:hypothetical protein